MFRLSREVRFAIDPLADPGQPVAGRNGFAGKPPISGLGQCYYTLSVTVAGRIKGDTGYLVNIKQIDEAVRHRVIPLVRRAIQAGAEATQPVGGRVLLDVFSVLKDEFRPHRLDALELRLSPLTSLCTNSRLLDRSDRPMLLLHHTFEFAASHRLHNPALSDEENREIFGKCNNPHGHGHNYILRVSLRGEVDRNGLVMDIAELERIVDEEVLEPFDHRHLNLEVPEFLDTNPSVENIAKVIFQKLRDPLTGGRVWLDSVTVWETPKTWCEYREQSD